MTYHLCPVCNKPHATNGSGHMNAIPKPLGGWCRCGGVPALLAERDHLRAENERLKADVDRLRSAAKRVLSDVDFVAGDGAMQYLDDIVCATIPPNAKT